MRSYSFVPGAVAANTATALPAAAPRYLKVASVVLQVEAAGGTASTTSPSQLTVVTSVPTGGLAAGDFYWDPVTQQYQVGTALTDGAVLTLHGWEYGEFSMVS